jgi:hypothetical protein
MPATVRATCPGCQSVLRIPAAWADRAVKCKRCGAVVRGKPKAAPPTTAAPTPVTPVRPLTPLTPSPATPAAPLPVPDLPVARPPAAATEHPQPVFPPEYVPPPAAYPYPPTPATPVAYPYPVPQAYPPPGYVDPAVAFDLTPTTRRYRRRRSGLGLLLWVAFALLLTGGLIAGGLFGLPYLKKLKIVEVATAPTDKQEPTQAEPKGVPPLKAAAAPFPRRMLVMHVSKYLYCNALTAGKGPNDRDQVTEAAKRLAFDWRVPQDPANNQLYLLSDTAGKDARPMLKSVIAEAVKQFCETSRPQDRVFLYFGGHAVEKDGKGYLVPTDGDLDDPASLIPLDDLWAKLKACPAQQKVVVFDVCRLNEDGDRVRPGGEPMTEALQKLLLAPPQGVQAVTTCSAGQNAWEYRRTPDDDAYADVSGSLFLSSVGASGKRKSDPATGTTPDDPLPIAKLVEAAAARMKEVTGVTGKPGQTPKLAGSEPAAAVAANPDEPPAKRFDFPAAPKGLAPVDVARITARIRLPEFRVRNDKATREESIEELVPFPADVMAAYKPDRVTEADIKSEPDKYPVRKTALDTLETIRKLWARTGGLNGMVTEFSGKTNDAVKKMILARQELPARAILELEGRVTAMEKLAGELDQEPSKYWRATFEYALAQAKARLAFMHEYNFALGNIRTDSLPKTDEGKSQVGLQLVSVEKMKSKKDVKEIADAARELFAKIEKEHKGTPWAVQAKRDKAAALGLEWQPYTRGASKPIE